jgi:L-asparagine transporter-like permease
MMQAPPNVAAAASMRQTVTLLVSLCVVIGIVVLALAGVVYSAGFAGQGNADLRQVWAPIVWNLGMMFLLVGILGTAVYRKTTDPLARLLLWFVALILVLLLVTAPGIYFTFR